MTSMRAFDHHVPQSLAEALDLLAAANGRRRIIAGGSDLLKQMRAGTVAPEAVISIRCLPELGGVTYADGDGLQLGAAVTLRQLTRSAVIARHYPCLANTASFMASEQIRSFATVGGNLCNASPAADLPPPLIALGASVCLASPAGERWLALEDFFLGPGESALGPGELLLEILVPPPAGGVVYLKHTSRVRMDCAGVGVAVGLRLDGLLCRTARIVLGAVAPVPLRAVAAEAELTGQAVTAARIARTAAVASEECTPIDDVRGAAWYRRRIVEVLVRRGLTALAGQERLEGLKGQEGQEGQGGSE